MLGAPLGAEKRAGLMCEKLQGPDPAAHVQKIPIQAAIGGKVVATRKPSRRAQGRDRQVATAATPPAAQLLDKQKARHEAQCASSARSNKFPQEAFIEALKIGDLMGLRAEPGAQGMLWGLLTRASGYIAMLKSGLGADAAVICRIAAYFAAGKGHAAAFGAIATQSWSQSAPGTPTVPQIRVRGTGTSEWISQTQTGPNTRLHGGKSAQPALRGSAARPVTNNRPCRSQIGMPDKNQKAEIATAHK